jgi:hypothetical protein
MEVIRHNFAELKKLIWINWMLFGRPEVLDRLNNLRRIRNVRRAQEALDGYSTKTR